MEHDTNRMAAAGGSLSGTLCECRISDEPAAQIEFDVTNASTNIDLTGLYCGFVVDWHTGGL